MSLLLGGNDDYYGNDFDVAVQESYTDDIGGYAIAHQEFMRDMVGVYECMHAADMAEIELRKRNNGVSLESCTYGVDEYEVVQENAFKSMWGKLKDALKKFWEKVKGFFKSVQRYFDALFMSGKEFAKKYRSDIQKAATRVRSDLEIKMYNFDDAKIDNMKTGIYDKADELINEHFKINSLDMTKSTDRAAYNADDNFVNYDDKRYSNSSISENISQKFRHYLIKNNTNGKIDADDYSKEIFGYFRNGAEDESDKEDIKASEVLRFVNILANDKASKDLKSLEKEMNKSFKKMIKQLETAEKESGRSSDATEKAVSPVITKMIACFEKCHAIANTFISGWKTAIKDRESAYKSACMKVLSAKKVN